METDDEDYVGSLDYWDDHHFSDPETNWYLSQPPLWRAQRDAQKSGYNLDLPMLILENDVSWLEQNEPTPITAIFYRALERLNPTIPGRTQWNAQFDAARERRRATGNRLPIKTWDLKNAMLVALIHEKVKSGETVPNSWKGFVVEDALGL